MHQARNESYPVCAVISAGTRDSVYAALYHTDNGNITRTGDYYFGDVSGLSNIIIEPAVLVGAGVKSYLQIIYRRDGYLKNIVKGIEAVPNGLIVANMASARFLRGEGDDVLSLTPLYLKESTAKAFINKYSGSA